MRQKNTKIKAIVKQRIKTEKNSEPKKAV